MMSGEELHHIGNYLAACSHLRVMLKKYLLHGVPETIVAGRRK